MPSQTHSQHWDSSRGKEVTLLVLSYGSSSPSPCHSCHPKGTPAPAALWVSFLSAFFQTAPTSLLGEEEIKAPRHPVLWGGLGTRQQHSIEQLPALSTAARSGIAGPSASPRALRGAAPITPHPSLEVVVGELGASPPLFLQSCLLDPIVPTLILQDVPCSHAPSPHLQRHSANLSNPSVMPPRTHGECNHSQVPPRYPRCCTAPVLPPILPFFSSPRAEPARGAAKIGGERHPCFPLGSILSQYPTAEVTGDP